VPWLLALAFRSQGTPQRNPHNGRTARNLALQLGFVASKGSIGVYRNTRNTRKTAG